MTFPYRTNKELTNTFKNPITLNHVVLDPHAEHEERITLDTPNFLPYLHINVFNFSVC